MVKHNLKGEEMVQVKEALFTLEGMAAGIEGYDDFVKANDLIQDLMEMFGIKDINGRSSRVYP